MKAFNTAVKRPLFSDCFVSKLPLLSSFHFRGAAFQKRLFSRGRYKILSYNSLEKDNSYVMSRIFYNMNSKSFPCGQCEQETKSTALSVPKLHQNEKDADLRGTVQYLLPSIPGHIFLHFNFSGCKQHRSNRTKFSS